MKSDLTQFAVAGKAMPRFVVRSDDVIVDDAEVEVFCQMVIGTKHQKLVCVSTEVVSKRQGKSLVVCWYMGMERAKKKKRKP